MDEQLSVQLIMALAQVWSRIREKHPRVPGVVIVTAPAVRDQPRVLGHFAALRWSAKGDAASHVHEVVVVAEHLDRPATDVVETLLHEAAHALNFERGFHDCSRSQYHNRVFKTAAEEVGLTVEQVPHYGFALTALREETREEYEKEITALREVLIHRRRLTTAPTGPGTTPGGDDNDDGKKVPTSRSRKATCRCPYIIRVSKKVMAVTTIRCGSCEEPFVFT